MYDLGFSSRIRILIIYPSRIPDPEVKKAPDLGSMIRIRNTDCGFLQMVRNYLSLFCWLSCKELLCSWISRRSIIFFPTSAHSVEAFVCMHPCSLSSSLGPVSGSSFILPSLRMSVLWECEIIYLILTLREAKKDWLCYNKSSRRFLELGVGRFSSTAAGEFFTRNSFLISVLTMHTGCMTMNPMLPVPSLLRPFLSHLDLL